MVDIPSPNRLNDEAEAVIVELEETFRSAGIAITSLVIEPAPDGSVGTGSWFNVGACISYVYEPGWVRLPEPPTIEPGAAVAINADWYELDGCT